MKRSAVLLAILVPALALAESPQGAVIASMDELTFTPPKAKGTAELVEGKVGKAVKFTFEKDARGTFFTSRIHGTPEWDKAAGISFWAKGDGTEQFGGLQLIYDGDFALRYDLCFPVKGNEWTKVTAAWGDFVPVLPNARAKPLGVKGNAPSKVSALWVGKWWYWGTYPAGSFAIDELRLEPTIERDTKDYQPEGAPLARVREKLKAGKPVTVVTMGDSLTATTHWANKQVVWPKLLAEQVKAKFGAELKVVNPAIGGTQLRQGLVLIPRWLAEAPEPDLVTICYGFNDWDAGMRGPEFEATYRDAVDRVRRATRGKADVLLVTTNPAVPRWETMAELAAAVRTVAKEKNTGLADTEKAFHLAGKDNREKLFVVDKVHLSPEGHAVVADTVFKAIESGGK